MPTFMVGHYVNADNKIKQIKSIAEKTNHLNISVIDMLYNKTKKEVYCIVDAPNENTIRNHYECANMMYDFIMPVEPIHTQDDQNREKFEIIGKLATNLAHDLRNPLAIIKNTLEIMETKQELQPKEMKSYYERMHNATDRISHQIEDVLDFVRTTQTNFERHLLNEILESALDKIVRPDTIKIVIPTNYVYVVCDFTKLEVVFTNLITNSIQAMSSVGQIEIKFLDDVNNTTIRISDTGCGIPQDDLPKIFEPLFTTKQTGTGLGLPSCKQIIEQHYGTIDVSSDVGRGTTFTISFPKNRFTPSYLAESELMQAR
ncbi:MAG: nickel-binding protein [Candidatus Nitrosotenuis sp.]